MEYTVNEQKVYTNACRELECRARLDILMSKENELLELLDLFIQGGNHREGMLTYRRNSIRDMFKPKIDEAKRQLKNCEKRLTYNLNRC